MAHFIAMIYLMILYSNCSESPDHAPTTKTLQNQRRTIALDLAEANRLSKLPMQCIQNQWPYKSGIVLSGPEDNALPIEHHPAFYGCFDWHSAVHGHWSLVYLLKTFPDLADRDIIIQMLNQNLTAEKINIEVEYFSLNRDTKSFERTYGWAWLLKLVEELHTWDHPMAKLWVKNLQPLTDYISTEYQSYLPKLIYPIRVGEHSNSAFGMSFAYDYAVTLNDSGLKNAIKTASRRFYLEDGGCPITWEPSGYDFLSPCLQELDIMRKVLPEHEFDEWSKQFLPSLFDQTITLDPAKVSDRSDGKLVHLDGLNFSRAWCLYSLSECDICGQHADTHLQYSLDKITDGDYAGQHWLASFALYAFKCQSQQ